MAYDGTPEPAAKLAGDVVARLRTARHWSRAKLIVRLYDELDPNDPNYDSISESWLARLENGRMVKVARSTIEALCRALQCTSQERARVLLYADRNGLTDGDSAPNGVAEALNYTMIRLYDEAYEILSSLIGRRRAADLDERELLELTATALELVKKQRRKR
jgi:transcriptional regulator with XRE-family HTH domain